MSRRRGFTLLELLVVITIILLISALTLPAILPAVSHREVSEAARILQGALVQARDTAIRYNAPRGVRFLPDPTYANTAGVLAYNRMLPIEPAPEYSNGMVTIWPQAFASTGAAQPWTNPAAPYPSGSGVGGGGSGYYPVGPMIAANTANQTGGQVLVLEQAPFQSNDATQFINAPTSWYWNIRVGDKIQIGGMGNTYTIVGPCTINPYSSGGQNPEMFVNVGAPGNLANYLTRTYTDSSGNPGMATPVEFLYLVNGIDDPQGAGDGYVDNGWDGIDNNGASTGQYLYNGVIDDLGSSSATASVPSEWEVETWQGALAVWNNPILPQTSGAFATPTGAANTSGFSLLTPSSYVITRRPVPSQSARETPLPNGVVIDVTTWNLDSERSRLPVDRFSNYTDILLQPSGQVVPTTLYSGPSSFSLGAAFYHFWIAERGDVHAPTELWGSTTSPNSAAPFILPMPQDAYTAYGLSNFTTKPQIALTGERILVTLFTRTGQLSSNSVEFFSCTDVNYPFYDSQLGAREAK